MSTAYIEIPRRRPVWLALRGAQLMLLLPLGALQLAAVVAFTTTADEMTTAAWVVAGAAVALDVAAIVLAFLLPRRTFLTRDAASMLIRAQVVLSLVKLIGYGDVAALVFVVPVGFTWLLLWIDERRHPSLL